MTRTEIISRNPKLSTNTSPIGAHGRCFTNSGPERTISVGYLDSSPRRRRAKERADRFSEGFVRFGLGAVPGRTRRQNTPKTPWLAKSSWATSVLQYISVEPERAARNDLTIRRLSLPDWSRLGCKAIARGVRPCHVTCSNRAR